ncbi:MAG TPA: phage terminase large subunit [Acidobacteriaceae bacterium]|jgi:predicted phage terminase large subunit-like protein|nr:phage terminase large subunit [Acidobacteriaceae bacterium]
MQSTAIEYGTLLRKDFVGFIERSFMELNPQSEFLPNWHIEVIAAALEDCRMGKTRRLIINVPPRSLKSHCASVAFPAFLLGHNPSAQILCASYGQDLADKHALDTRSIVGSSFYRKTFPTRISPLKHAVGEFMTTQGGSRLATSVGGVITGRGADFIIIDDPLKPEEALSETRRKSTNDWYEHTLVSRLNDKRTGCIILIMQRLHEDDLVGHVQQFGEWKVLRFPAIAEEEERHTFTTWWGETKTYVRHRGELLHPEREPLVALEEMRQTLGEYNFAGQYQQAPAPLEGGMIKMGWFKTYRDADLPEAFEFVFQSWDTANKITELSDYSVCTTWGVSKGSLYLRHVFRRRLEYPDLKRAVRTQADVFSARNVLIEDKASGTQLIQELIREGFYPVTRYSITIDKIMRMHSVTSTIENGFVYLPEKAEWLAQYTHELTTFPKGKYNDQVDSTSQALDWIRNRNHCYGLLVYHQQIMDGLTEDTRATSLFLRPCGPRY